MPKEKRPLDVEALLYWLVEKLETHIAGGDQSVAQLFSVALAAFADTTAVDSSGAAVAESDTFAVIQAAFADTTAVDSTGSAVAESDSFSPALPAFGVTTLVI